MPPRSSRPYDSYRPGRDGDRSQTSQEPVEPPRHSSIEHGHTMSEQGQPPRPQSTDPRRRHTSHNNKPDPGPIQDVLHSPKTQDPTAAWKDAIVQQTQVAFVQREYSTYKERCHLLAKDKDLAAKNPHSTFVQKQEKHRQDLEAKCKNLKTHLDATNKEAQEQLVRAITLMGSDTNKIAQKKDDSELRSMIESLQQQLHDQDRRHQQERSTMEEKMRIHDTKYTTLLNEFRIQQKEMTDLSNLREGLKRLDAARSEDASLSKSVQDELRTKVEELANNVASWKSTDYLQQNQLEAYIRRFNDFKTDTEASFRQLDLLKGVDIASLATTPQLQDCQRTAESTTKRVVQLGTQVNTLSTQLRQLELTISNQQSGSQLQLQPEERQALNNLQLFNQSLRNFSNSIKNIDNRTKALDHTVIALNSRYNNLTSDRLIKRMVTIIEPRIGSMKAGLSSIDAEISRIRQEQLIIRDSQSKLAKDATDCQTRTAEVAKVAREAEELSKDLKSMLTELQTRVSDSEYAIPDTCAAHSKQASELEEARVGISKVIDAKSKMFQDEVTARLEEKHEVLSAECRAMISDIGHKEELFRKDLLDGIAKVEESQQDKHRDLMESQQNTYLKLLEDIGQAKNNIQHRLQELEVQVKSHSRSPADLKDLNDPMLPNQTDDMLSTARSQAATNADAIPSLVSTSTSKQISILNDNAEHSLDNVSEHGGKGEQQNDREENDTIVLPDRKRKLESFFTRTPSSPPFREGIVDLTEDEQGDYVKSPSPSKLNLDMWNPRRTNNNDPDTIIVSERSPRPRDIVTSSISTLMPSSRLKPTPSKPANRKHSAARYAKEDSSRAAKKPRKL